jgi:glutamine amidotransferase
LFGFGVWNMCRWAAYRGTPVYLEDVVSAPSHSLIAQSHQATHGLTPTNGDGFGIAWYGERPEPGLYRDILPAWSDSNLKSLARQIRSGLFLAHVRASTIGATNRDNCHPFVQGRWSFMHNGHVADFHRLERRLEGHLSNMLYNYRTGTTDSELLFLLAMQMGLARDPHGAMSAAINLVAAEAASVGIHPVIRFTSAFSDGETLYAIRYATDLQAPSLYARTCGNGTCRLVSEPLDDDGDNWLPVAQSAFVVASAQGFSVRRFDPLASEIAQAV